MAARTRYASNVQTGITSPNLQQSISPYMEDVVNKRKSIKNRQSQQPKHSYMRASFDADSRYGASTANKLTVSGQGNMRLARHSLVLPGSQ